MSDEVFHSKSQEKRIRSLRGEKAVVSAQDTELDSYRAQLADEIAMENTYRSRIEPAGTYLSGVSGTSSGPQYVDGDRIRQRRLVAMEKIGGIIARSVGNPGSSYIKELSAIIAEAQGE